MRVLCVCVWVWVCLFRPTGEARGINMTTVLTQRPCTYHDLCDNAVLWAFNLHGGLVCLHLEHHITLGNLVACNAPMRVTCQLLQSAIRLDRCCHGTPRLGDSFVGGIHAHTPSLTTHLDITPSVMVGDSAGSRTVMVPVRRTVTKGRERDETAHTQKLSQQGHKIIFSFHRSADIQQESRRVRGVGGKERTHASHWPLRDGAGLPGHEAHAAQDGCAAAPPHGCGGVGSRLGLGVAQLHLVPG